MELDTIVSQVPEKYYQRSTTIVTALYDIGRADLQGKYAHRSFDKYLSWFHDVLSMNAPMFIVIPQSLYSYVTEHRNSGYPTKIVIREFADLEAYQRYYQRMQDTIDYMRKHHHRSAYNDCPEFITANYEVMIYSKFNFMYEAANENPFNTKYFIWLDAGIFRSALPFDSKLPWPNPEKIEILEDRFLIANEILDVENKQPLEDKAGYLRENHNQISAHIMGGTQHAINTVHHDFWVAVDDALASNVINNEQHILSLMILEDPEKYFLWKPTGGKYPQYPQPMRDRMIPYELALATPLSYDYPIHPNIRVISTATREIRPEQYQKWLNSVRHYGYRYSLVGRDVKWDGFNSKIRCALRELDNVTEEYCMVTDCTDLFFVASSTETHDKLCKLDKQHSGAIFVGGEMYLHYKGDKSKDIITEDLKQLGESKQCYPNSGCVMGRTSAVRDFFRSYQDYADDQAACIDNIVDHRMPMIVDYHTEIIGNVPNYAARHVYSENYFSYDSTIGRYYNKISGEYPVVFHFPGQYFGIMNTYYHDQKMLPKDMSTGAPLSGFFWLTIIIIIAIVLVAAYFQYM